MIIDVHAHLGEDYVFDDVQTEEQLMAAYDEAGVQKAIVQPFICRPYIEDTRAAHDRIAAMCAKYPGRIYGMASINPHFRHAEYEEEASRCVKELGFVGLKLTTIAHAVNPSSTDGMHVFAVAEALGVPVMIHTGLGAPLASPMNIWKAAEAFRGVKIVLAHTGGNEQYGQAQLLARHFENIYLEPSWMPSTTIGAMVNEFGADRVMFSSDIIGNLLPALQTFRAQIKDVNALDWALWKTASTVYKI